jgi:hypothetical protein
MKSIIVIVKEYPKTSIFVILGLIVAVIAGIVGIKSCIYSQLDYIDKHTPKLEIVDAFFSYDPFPGGNNTGIVIIYANQSNAWAKNVMIDFINDDGYSKYEKVKYFRKENIVVNPKEIPPNSNKNLDGWRPQGPSASPTIYQNNEKKYKVNIFINWENDKGEEYSLVRGYESIVDNIDKQIRFKPIYRYDTFKDKKKVTGIKKANKDYLPDDML